MKQKGFTLIEVMVALMVFAVLSAIVSQTLSVAIKTRDRFAKPDPQEMKLQLALVIIERDLQQLINRPITQGLGLPELALLWEPDKKRLSFTRTGLRYAPDDPRPIAIGRVGYEVSQGQLYRLHWPYLDRIKEDVIRQPLLKNVKTINWRFIGNDGNTYAQWPPTQQWNTEIPMAVVMSLELTSGLIEAWILTPGQRYVR